MEEKIVKNININTTISDKEAEEALKIVTYNLPEWAKYDHEVAEAANKVLAFIRQSKEVYYREFVDIEEE